MDKCLLTNIRDVHSSSLLILRKNFENSDSSMYAICVGLGKFCSQFALFTKQGQKLVLSDALAVQSQGVRVSRSKGFKS